MSSLASLSTELLLLILESLTTPKDLASAIRASAQFYRTFLAYKHSTLRSILLHAIHPAAQADFLFAIDAQRIKEFIYNGADTSWIKEKCFSLLERHTSKKAPNLSVVLSDRSRLHQLVRFYSAVEDLMTDYCNRALSQLPPPLGKEQNLSSTEVARLQRAFYRSEVYVKLFGVTQITLGELSPLQSRQEPAQEFLARLKPWEVEEIACVIQFLAIRIEEVFDKMENDFVSVISAMVESYSSEPSKDLPSSPTGDLSPSSATSDLDYHDGFHELEDECLWLLGKSHKRLYHNGHIDFLVSRGLLFVHNLLRVEFPIARLFILDTDFESHGKPRLRRGLHVSHFLTNNIDRERSDEISRVTLSFSGDSLNERNLGWLWAWRYHASTVTNAHGNFNLRNQGYVFWDQGRLESSGMVEGLRDLQCLWGPPPRYQDRSQLPSVGERLRLKHIHVPVGVITELSKEVFNPLRDPKIRNEIAEVHIKKGPRFCCPCGQMEAEIEAEAEVASSEACQSA